MALCHFIAESPHYVTQKKVLELAGGLGLPSLLAAQYAKEVCCSDYLPEAVEVMQRSINYNGLKNMTCTVLDWHELSTHAGTDVLLLSDVNYEPGQFDVLHNLISRFLRQGTTVLLSTPQRLVAKPFVQKLLPLCRHRQEICASYPADELLVSVLVLKE